MHNPEQSICCEQLSKWFTCKIREQSISYSRQEQERKIINTEVRPNAEIIYTESNFFIEIPSWYLMSTTKSHLVSLSPIN